MSSTRIRLFRLLLLTLSVYFFSAPAFAQKKTNSALSLSPVEKSIATIAALTAKGDLPQLSKALRNGLAAGLTINEEKEVLVHLYAYCGFPRSIQGLNTLMAVVADRKKNGIEDKAGRKATPPVDSGSRYQRGKEALETLTGQPEQEPKTGYAAFSPEIEIFLKEHLFADIFSRDVLDYKTREIATVSALVSLGGVEPMLKSHLTITLHQGVTISQATQLISIIEPYVGKEKAAIASNILKALPAPTQQAGSGTTTAPPVINKEKTTSFNPPQQGLIFPTGNKINSSNFTGATWLQSLMDSDSLNDIKIGNVTFEPGARTAWHYHPGGQILMVMDGTGYYQEKGSTKRILHKGDVVKCPPNLPHWHGASQADHFVQVAVSGTKQGETVWLQPVSQEEYNQ